MTNALGTILLADDSDNDVWLMRRAFAKAEVTATLTVVSDGEAAINYLEGKPPYEDRSRHPLPMLVLLDLQMPKISGIEVLAWLRVQPLLKYIPVVVLTSSDDDRDIQRAYDLGANSYLVKPPTAEQLIPLVRSLHDYWATLNRSAFTQPPPMADVHRQARPLAAFRQFYPQLRPGQWYDVEPVFRREAGRIVDAQHDRLTTLRTSEKAITVPAHQFEFRDRPEESRET